MRFFNLAKCAEARGLSRPFNNVFIGKAENKSWYDSKLIPYIDDGGASLDNLYLPENAIQEVV